MNGCALILKVRVFKTLRALFESTSDKNDISIVNF